MSWESVSREVSLTRAGLPTLASTNLATTEVLRLAVYTPTANRVRDPTY